MLFKTTTLQELLFMSICKPLIKKPETKFYRYNTFPIYIYVSVSRCRKLIKQFSKFSVINFN